jgi:soluble lytic murein transglycosylase-like protein
MSHLRIVAACLALSLCSAGATAAQSSVKKAGNALERAASGRNAKKISERYDPTFRKYTKRYFGPAFDWRLFKAQAIAESNLNVGARSPVGARGIMQLREILGCKFSRREGVKWDSSPALNAEPNASP